MNPFGSKISPFAVRCPSEWYEARQVPPKRPPVVLGRADFGVGAGDAVAAEDAAAAGADPTGQAIYCG